MTDQTTRHCGSAAQHGRHTFMRLEVLFQCPGSTPVPPPADVRDQTIRALSRVLLDSGGRLVPKHIAETARAVQESADAVLRVPAIAEALEAVATVARVRHALMNQSYLTSLDEAIAAALDPQEQP